MKIEYNFFADDCPRCQVKDPFINNTKLGSVTCQMCDHLKDIEKGSWIDCELNAGREDESQ